MMLSVNLQSDLQYWEKKWLLKFNASKCHVLKITRATEHELKYLGMQSDLQWSQHIHHIATRANCMCFIFIKRNLKFANKCLRETAYFTLVQSQLDYASMHHMV